MSLFKWKVVPGDTLPFFFPQAPKKISQLERKKLQLLQQQRMDINLVKRGKNYYIVLPQHQTINMYHRRQQPPYGTSTTRKMAQSSDETIHTIQCRMCILLLSMLCILLLSYQLDIIRNTAMHYIVSIFCGHSESE